MQTLHGDLLIFTFGLFVCKDLFYHTDINPNHPASKNVYLPIKKGPTRTVQPVLSFFFFFFLQTIDKLYLRFDSNVLVFMPFFGLFFI